MRKIEQRAVAGYGKDGLSVQRKSVSLNSTSRADPIASSAVIAVSFGVSRAFTLLSSFQRADYTCK